MRRSLLAVTGLAFLAACAQEPLRPPPPASDLQHFQLEGRLSVHQGESAHHVGISWQHDAKSDEILLTGPLGQGLAQLKRDASGARLVTADRQSFTAADWEGLAERVFGARLPLSDMPRWVVGAAPGPGAKGWRIDYLEFAGGLPVLMEMRRDDIKVRLKVDSWGASQ